MISCNNLSDKNGAFLDVWPFADGLLYGQHLACGFMTGVFSSSTGPPQRSGHREGFPVCSP